MSAWIEIARATWKPHRALGVALYMSAWIEIHNEARRILFCYVALYMSAWIEMLREDAENAGIDVALYMSAWIEIGRIPDFDDGDDGRTLYECVD